MASDLALVSLGREQDVGSADNPAIADVNREDPMAQGLVGFCNLGDRIKALCGKTCW
jgi:hypothetical protein